MGLKDPDASLTDAPGYPGLLLGGKKEDPASGVVGEGKTALKIVNAKQAWLSLVKVGWSKKPGLNPSLEFTLL